MRGENKSDGGLRGNRACGQLVTKMCDCAAAVRRRNRLMICYVRRHARGMTRISTEIMQAIDSGDDNGTEDEKK
jgi:hypothetical protein